MNKLNFLMLIYPLLFNLMIIMIMTLPSKIFNFHPIILIIALILITLMICLKMNFFTKNIIPFILFLSFISGLMVIFIYITSLANNELFNFNQNLLISKIFKIIIFMMIMLIFFLLFYQILMMNPIKSFHIEKMNLTNFSINSMYSEINNKSSIYIMMYLYYTMICIIKICLKIKSPLRQLTF